MPNPEIVYRASWPIDKSRYTVYRVSAISHKCVAFLGFGPHALKALKPLDYLRHPQTLPEILLTERKRRRLFQRDVAKLLSCPLNRYIGWEIGRCVTLPQNWPSLISYLGFDPLEEVSTLRGRADALRRQSGLTYQQIAEQLGVDRETLMRWLHSETRPAQKKHKEAWKLLEEKFSLHNVTFL